MKLTEENLDQLAFTYMISSGPNVCIYYSKDVDNFYAILHKNPRKPWDILVVEISIFIEAEVSNPQIDIKNRIRSSILDFISKDRDDKIDSILN